MSGEVFGNLVQAGVINQLTVNAVAVRAPEPPRELGPSRTLINQAPQLGLLDRLLESGPRAAVVTGPRGSGKTALAQHWGNRHKERFPAGQIVVDVDRYRGDNGVEATDVFARLLHSLGVHPELVPDTLDGRAKLYATKVETGAWLIVLDNVGDLIDIEQFVPASDDSALIVTSRRARDDLDDAVEVTVSRLDPEHGLRLLADASGREEWAEDERHLASTVIELCDRMADAIKLAGRRLRRVRGLTLAELASEPLGGGAIAYATKHAEGSYDNLPERDRQALRDLVALPGTDFDIPLAAAVLGVDQATAQDIVNELADVYLIDETPDGRFAYRGLVERFARDLVRHEIARQDAVLRAAAEWYRSTATLADVMIMPPKRLRAGELTVDRDDARQVFATDVEALAWFESERANLLAVVTAANERGWHDLAWRIVDSCSSWFLKRAPHDLWTALCERAVDSAVHCGHKRAEARMRALLARALWERGSFDPAFTQLDAARAAAEQGEPAMLASTYEFTARRTVRAASSTRRSTGAGGRSTCSPRSAGRAESRSRPASSARRCWRRAGSTRPCRGSPTRWTESRRWTRRRTTRRWPSAASVRSTPGWAAVPMPRGHCSTPSPSCSAAMPTCTRCATCARWPRSPTTRRPGGGSCAGPSSSTSCSATRRPTRCARCSIGR
ncbi:Cdc6-like AAA superfamily ATPase [Herbihabitans rhizosphaerae]|uniref:Cdc6-like AAA superfamily ATPase n=1 Tax=Herbihabitans rhizosphaerae TaxID=1872711 RepID=A0A4Q7KNI5_9PSEU|nr:hypothetical protein [Herbihabitans rhizosphaerae]RZS37530.1 Cdc6-like AAA superfamily ATPase [Herbihabitans rhizosphaerae]